MSRGGSTTPRSSRSSSVGASPSRTSSRVRSTSPSKSQSPKRSSRSRTPSVKESPAAARDEAEPTATNLAKLTLAELKTKFLQAGIECKGLKTKADLIEALREGAQHGLKDSDDESDKHSEGVGKSLRNQPVQEEDEEEDEEEEEEEEMQDTQIHKHNEGARQQKIDDDSDDDDNNDESEGESDEEQRALQAISKCSFFGGAQHAGGNGKGAEDDDDDDDDDDTPGVSAIDTQCVKTYVGMAMKDSKKKKKKRIGSLSLASGLDGVGKIAALKQKNSVDIRDAVKLDSDVDKLMERSNIDILDKSKLQLDPPGLKPPKKTDTETRAERWFGMKSSPLDLDAKYTLALIANRNAIDPKKHYRKESRKPNAIPSLFQVGTVMNSSTDFYSSRLSRKDRKPNLASEILNDDRLRPYIKNKFDSLQAASEKSGKNAFKEAEKRRQPKWKKHAVQGKHKRQRK